MIASSRIGKLKARNSLLDGMALKPTDAILDVGCGRGLLLIGAARRATNGHATGIDLWSQVDQLKQKVLDALIAQDPYQEGIDAIDQAVNAVLGKATQAEIKTGLNVITRETVADGSATKFIYKTDC
jgi:ABC-type sugar transport system substrate-binding protein